MKQTFKFLTDADQIVAQIYVRNPKLRESKFGYAWKRFYEKNIEPTMKELRREFVDIQIDNALEDENTKEILVDKQSNRGFKYSKESLRKCVSEENAAMDKFNKVEIEFDPYICASIPEEVTEEEKEELKGLII